MEINPLHAESIYDLGLHIVHLSIQGNHLHMMIEAQDRRALSRGMQGLTIRMARGLNREMEISGKVFADRYHARILRTQTEVRRALHYIWHNRALHVNPELVGYVDERTSLWRVDLVVPARTWLQRTSVRALLPVPS